jgi:hypothetical protein
MHTSLRSTLLALVGLVGACDVAGDEVSTTRSAGNGAAVPLALDVDDATGTPLILRAGQVFYLEQVDLRTTATSSIDEGVDGLQRAGELSALDWTGLHVRDTDFLILPNFDGTFTRRRFYLDAAWMNESQRLILQQVDASGAVVGHTMNYPIAAADETTQDDDSFYIRRLRAIQWTNDCVAPQDCDGASHFFEEALVELRASLAPARTFVLDARTTALRLTWSANGHVYTIPVTQDAAPPYAYGFQIGVAPVSSVPPVRADGTYAPGSAITFKVTLRDGAGQRLHPDGQMPSYFDVQFGANPAGIQYYRAFFDATSLFYRRKHRERMFMSEIVGPIQNAQPIRSEIPIPDLLSPDVDVQPVGDLERDGVFAQYRTFPTSNKLFGGAFDPAHTAWFEPVPDTWTFTLPDDAPAGTYKVTTKARRVFQGEDIAAHSIVSLQVGTTTPTFANLGTGNCQSCHTGTTGLGRVLHTIADRSTCAGCHAPLPFETNAPVYVRLHFIHSRSPRYDAVLSDCTECHTSSESIQRTSKSACLSCHDSYPADHVASYGPVIDPYVGGSPGIFDACTNACHTTHPDTRFSHLKEIRSDGR